jgi:alkylhydroperoxidase/carboxymuconolactone decarboxylase family protein YurZ
MSDPNSLVGERGARRLFGDERYDRTRTNAPAGHQRDLLLLADEIVFGRIYPRDGLGPTQRSLCTIAALTVLGHLPQLRAHVGAALNIGVGPDEIVEVVTQMAMYGGFPSALNAMQIVDECLHSQHATEQQ